MPTWPELVAMASALPGVEEGSAYGTPALRVKGKFLCRLREDGSVAMPVDDLGEKEALVQGQSDAFFTTPHYDGYAMVLIRLDRVDPVELGELVEDAWRARAPKRLVAAHDAERGD